VVVSIVMIVRHVADLIAMIVVRAVVLIAVTIVRRVVRVVMMIAVRVVVLTVAMIVVRAVVLIAVMTAHHAGVLIVTMKALLGVMMIAPLRNAGQLRYTNAQAVVRLAAACRNPPERSREDWIDEGSTRPIRRPSGVRGKITGRSQKGGRKEVRALDAVVEEFEKVLGSRASSRAVKRYEAALQAFEAHRYDDARKILSPMAREYANVSAVREMFGLCLYRGGQWKRALGELETAVKLNPDWIFNHAVIADCHRALGNHQLVEQYWRELAEASPHPELMAEGRIVMAGSLADRGLFVEAMDLMDKAAGDMKRPSEYHLRQWFVIADLYDRQGNVIKARHFFERIALHDAQFVDVAERLSTLGY
jgi:hypothetical protein